MSSNEPATAEIIVRGRPFLPIWLRDNCLCDQCRHPTSFQKLVDIGELPATPRVRAFEVTEDFVVIDWDEIPGHRSEFPVDWLVAHSCGAAAGTSEEPEVYWSADTWRHTPVPMFDIGTCDPSGGEWAAALLRYGFVVLRNVDDVSHRAIAEGVGPLHNTEFGDIIVQRSLPNTNDLVETGHALSPHTDYSVHMRTPPLLQFMFFRENAAAGGNTILVDGFAVAADFHRAHPDLFQLLATVPVSFQQVYANWQLFHKRTRTIIELDADDRVDGVYFGHSHACNWVLPPELMEPFYRAYFAFFASLKDPGNQLVMKVRPGDCVVMRNGRLLHGRTAFDSNSGARTVVNAFVSWEHFEARVRFHRNKHLYRLPMGVG